MQLQTNKQQTRAMLSVPHIPVNTIRNTGFYLPELASKAILGKGDLPAPGDYRALETWLVQTKLHC